MRTPTQWPRASQLQAVSAWCVGPAQLSLGAQKNFAAFAKRIGQSWRKTQDDFNEAWFREAVAKAIIFKKTERIVSDQPWYQGGYRANIVAYSIAKIAHDIAEYHKAVDFETIWRRQAPGPAMFEAIAAVAMRVHSVLTEPPVSMSNVTEWAKKQGCWDQVRGLAIDWPEALDDELMSTEEQTTAARGARREQRTLNAIEAQIAVVNAGGKFWADALAWGKTRNFLTPTEIGILKVAASIPKQTPTDKQSSKTMELLSKLQSEGYREEL